jgi:thioredoxin reductase/NAD-dependent dihydropyrimidine dehydrogenase PreA subunit
MTLIEPIPQIAAIAAAVLVATAIYRLWLRRNRKEEEEVLATLEDMAALGEVVPDTIHPIVDPNRCIGSGGCVRACPEKFVLGIVRGQATVMNPLACVGHSACVSACPVQALKLVFGSAERGVELPLLDPHFQTTRPGVYVVGELGGMGLIRNAVRQGRQAADHVVAAGRRGASDAYDAVVVGAGPAGVSATLRLMQAGLRVVLLERDAVGGAIMHYPRAKVVMTGALEFALAGSVKRRTMSKEDLVALWRTIMESHGVPAKTGVMVHGVHQEPDGMWRLDSSAGSVRAANALLALGRRGTPRKLEVPGEEQAKVQYALAEPDPFASKHVLVVGGGNSAVEAALALADFDRCASVSISYRREAFARCRADNRRRIDEAIRTGKVCALLSTKIERIRERDVVLSGGGGEVRIPNDAVIVQIGGTAPSELLQAFGIQVVTKHGGPELARVPRSRTCLRPCRRRGARRRLLRRERRHSPDRRGQEQGVLRLPCDGVPARAEPEARRPLSDHLRRLPRDRRLDSRLGRTSRKQVPDHDRLAREPGDRLCRLSHRLSWFGRGRPELRLRALPHRRAQHTRDRRRAQGSRRLSRLVADFAPVVPDVRMPPERLERGADTWQRHGRVTDALRRFPARARPVARREAPEACTERRAVRVDAARFGAGRCRRRASCVGEVSEAEAREPRPAIRVRLADRARRPQWRAAACGKKHRRCREQGQ